MVSRPIVFFDRDGTLNHDAGYTHRVEDLRWLEGAIEAVRAVNQYGWLAVVVTNQAGVARGLYDEAAVDRFHARMQEELSAAGAQIDAFYYCPFHAEATIPRYRHPDHPDRKPNPGMLARAFADLPADRARALMIGDRELDLEAGRAAGCAVALADGRNLREVMMAALCKLDWNTRHPPH